MWLLKHYRLVPIQQNPILNVPADCAGEHHFFDVAAFFDELFDGVAVRDADYVLLDDRAIIEDFGDVVGSCSYQLDSSLESLMVRAGTDEGWKERMVDVNEVLGADGGRELGREYMHVAR